MTEKALGAWPRQLKNPFTSANGLHVAYAIVIEDAKESLVVHDDAVNKDLRSILSPIGMSPDGKHVAYWASTKEKKVHMVVDHVLDREYPNATTTAPVWNADGTRLAYVVPAGKQFAVVMDGITGQPWDDLDPTTLQFSPDGKHLCYVATKDKKQVLVADGVAGTAYDDIDGSSVAYNSRGDRLAFLAASGKRSFAVIDGIPDSALDEITAGVLAWSPDGDHIAYTGRRGKEWYVVVDGKLGPRFRAINPPVFSADGKHLAFYGVEDGAANNPKRRVLIRDGVVVARGQLASVCLSADGARMAYVEQMGSKWSVVVDGARGPEFDGIRLGHPEFSPDGRRVSYVAVRGDRWMLIIDDKIRAEHDEIGRLPPGEILRRGEGHLSYAAADGGKWKVRHDGGIGREYDRVLNNGPAVHTDGTAEFLAVRGDTLFRVTQRP